MPEKDETGEIIYKMNINKSPGEKVITAENLKIGGEIVSDEMRE